MPKRKETTRAKRLNEQVLNSLREIVLSGTPWTKAGFDGIAGDSDVYGLISGHFFFPKYCSPDDEESQRVLWDELKEDIVREHIKYSPGTRPSGWWRWERPELRRVVGRDCVNPDHDDDCAGDHDDGRLPADQDPNLPGWAKGQYYFGTPSVYDGFRYESQPDYLARLKLLAREEAAILKKYGEIRRVRISSGTIGQCEACWKNAHELARKIDFNLADAIKLKQFWIPDDLISDCEHNPGTGQGIFSYL